MNDNGEEVKNNEVTFCSEEGSFNSSENEVSGIYDFSMDQSYESEDDFSVEDQSERIEIQEES